jgi:hypothetical protein
MSVALCLYGHFRCFDLCYPELQENLIKPNFIQHIFAVSWLDSMGYFQHPEQSLQPRSHVGYDVNSAAPTPEFLAGIYQRLGPVSADFGYYQEHDHKFAELVEKYKQFHHPSPSHRPKGTLSQVYGRCKSLKLCRDYEHKNSMQFDRIICTRWDIAYTSPIVLETLDSRVISMDGMYGQSVISDAWACGPSDAMQLWSEQFDSIEILANQQTLNLGPHEWLQAHFDYYKIPWQNRPDIGIWIRR